MEVVIKSQETKEGVCFRVIKDDEFKFINIKFNNYFYIKTSDYETYKIDFLKTYKWCLADTEIYGQFTKIILSSNWMRNKVRNFWEERCHTYEADIKANKRFMLDNKIELNNTLIPYTFYDIETDDRLPLVKDERGNVVPQSRILSFAGVDHKGVKVYYELNSESDEDEAALLTMIINYFGNYGVISGWYSEKFDMPYIKGRCDKLGINYQILDYINHLDYKELFSKYDKKSRKSNSLNAISNEVLNESKIDQEKGGGAIYNTWLTNKPHLQRYNLEDSNLIYKINLKRMFIEVSMKRADNAKCHVRNTVNNSDSGDYLLMRKYKERNIVMPSQPTKDEVFKRRSQGSIGGGYTTCLKPGFHKNVLIWDFKSEYPSVIQTWNISPETYVDTIHNEEDAKAIDKTKFIVTPHDFEGVYHPARVYRKDIEGVIPTVVRELVEERDKIKYTMNQFKTTDPDKYKQKWLEQYALKTDSNSIYGILAFPMSRYYSWELGDSVTTCARATLKACNAKVIEWGCDVIGGDTDSSFVILGPNHTKEEIDDKYVAFLHYYKNQYGCKVNKLVFEYEKTFKTMLFVKKKHYGYIDDDGLTIKGMEAIKSDTNKLAAELQRQFITEVLEETYVEDVWRDKVETIYNKVYNQEMSSAELTLVKALTKMPKDYIGPTMDSKTGRPKIKADGTIQMKSIPAHVKLAKRLISKGKDIYPGSKIPFIVIQTKPILAISPEEYAIGSGVFWHKHRKHGETEYEWEGEYDSTYYWERILKPLVKVVHGYHRTIPDWEWGLTDSQFNKILKDKDKD